MVLDDARAMGGESAGGACEGENVCDLGHG